MNGTVCGTGPASLVVLLTVSVVWPLAGIDVPGLHRDVWWALAWLSNWGTITGGGDYWSRFGDPSPITHFWSLAVEEQYYLVWPVVLVVVLRLTRRHRRAVGVVSLALAAASIAYMNLRFDPAAPSATYMDTFARAHSLLLGAAAAALTTTTAAGRLRGGALARRLVIPAALGAIALVAATDEHADWLFHWGFPLFAVLAVVVVVAAADGWGVRMLGARPMRWVADRSYALYLWHWPVILFLSPARVGVDGAALDVVRVAVAVGFADLSLRIVETPIRRRTLLVSWRAPLAAGLAMCTIAAVAVLGAPSVADTPSATVVTLPPVVASESPAPAAATASADPTTVAWAGLSETIAHRAAMAPVTGSATATAEVGEGATGPAVQTPVRVLVAGDSTAANLAESLMAHAQQHPEQLVVGSAAFPGCGLTAADDGRLHEFTDASGARQLVDLRGCTDEWVHLPDRIAAEQIGVVLVMIGPWDAVDIHLVDGSVVSVADPVGAAMVTEAYRSFTERVQAAGASVVFVRPTDGRAGWDDNGDPLADPARWVALRTIVDGLHVPEIDLPAWLAANGLTGPDARPDGMHMTREVDDRFVRELVAPTLVHVGRQRTTA